MKKSQSQIQNNKTTLGGSTYDAQNRLIHANGKAKTASYQLDMAYGIMGEPLTKKQKVDSSKVAQSYAFAYLYEDSEYPTVPSQIGHNHYTYDANGKPLTVTNDSTSETREMYWDEDNRLMVLSDNGKTCRYTYNAAGERIIKSHGDLEGVYINGAPQGITFHETEDYTIYPAPIITVTKNRFTKHYFVGDKRVASKLGVGKFSNVYGISGNNVTAGQKDYAARMMQIEKQREEYYKSRETPPGIPTMKGATADPDNTHRGYNDIIGDLGDHSVPEGWVQRPKFNEKGDVPGPPIQWQKPEDPDNAQPGYGYVPADTTNTEEIFFYHSDHLGSTSYITDAKANITQFDAYLPYGELLVDEHSSSEEMPYKFNGKELDQETGLYYYGARYMNPIASIWYGVDPMMEKYPHMSSYAYCMNNPINVIDPIGADTLNITYNESTKKWTFTPPVISKGNDVFIIHIGKEVGKVEFSEDTYGDRLDMLNVYVGNFDGGYTLGIYHLSGSSSPAATGYYITPGGTPSTEEDSGRRVPEGTYPMTTPNGSEGWRQPGLGGAVIKRGVKIHFGYPKPRKWTKACFVISSDYTNTSEGVMYNKVQSRNQLVAFDKLLGATNTYKYRLKGKGYDRIGATFKHNLQKTISVKTLRSKWQRQ